MRVLLVTVSEMLPFVFTKVLNPALEYCAIVVDEPEQAKKILSNTPLEKAVFPFYELKECMENFHYDCILCPSPFWEFPNYETFKKWDIPKDSLVSLPVIHTVENFFIERALRYYKEHAAEFEMFATGDSHAEFGLIPKKFKHKLFNFGHTSQDLYYSYQIAKYVLTKTGGGAHQVLFD